MCFLYLCLKYKRDFLYLVSFLLNSFCTQIIFVSNARKRCWRVFFGHLGFLYLISLLRRRNVDFVQNSNSFVDSFRQIEILEPCYQFSPRNDIFISRGKLYSYSPMVMCGKQRWIFLSFRKIEILELCYQFSLIIYIFISRGKLFRNRL